MGRFAVVCCYETQLLREYDALNVATLTVGMRYHLMQGLHGFRQVVYVVVMSLIGDGIFVEKLGIS